MSAHGLIDIVECNRQVSSPSTFSVLEGPHSSLESERKSRHVD